MCLRSRQDVQGEHTHDPEGSWGCELGEGEKKSMRTEGLSTGKGQWMGEGDVPHLNLGVRGRKDGQKGASLLLLWGEPGHLVSPR